METNIVDFKDLDHDRIEIELESWVSFTGNNTVHLQLLPRSEKTKSTYIPKLPNARQHLTMQVALSLASIPLYAIAQNATSPDGLTYRREQLRLFVPLSSISVSINLV